MVSKPNREEQKWRSHVYRSRAKHGGWYNRRFGKNPRWADTRLDAFREEKREKQS